MKTEVIIPAAGFGVRFESKQAKSLVLLGPKPILVHTLQAFEQSVLVDDVILVTQEPLIPEIKDLIKQYKLSKVKHIVTGGQARSESVRNGLKYVDQDTEFVVIHDGARPLITGAFIDKIIPFCYREQALITAVPVKPTIKRVDKNLVVAQTLKRDELWEIQTPQIFKREIILKAHQEFGHEDTTDDAALVEKLGVKVKVVMGDYRNIKITTKEDLAIAETLLNRIS